MKIISNLCFTLLLIYHSLAVAAKPPDQSRQLIGHGGPVNSVAISPDGKQAISGSLDYSVMLWDIDQPKPVNTKRLIAHRGAVSKVRFLPSGKEALSSGDDGTIYLWDVVNQRLLHRFEGHEAKIVSLDFTADSKILASASWDGTVRLWDLPNRKALQTIKVHKETVHSVLLSADGKAVYSGSFDGRIRNYRTEDGSLSKVLHNHGWPVNIMRWHPDHQHIIFGTTNGDVQLLDTASAQITKILIPHQKPVLGLEVSDQFGLIATGGNDGVIRVWDINDWSVVGETEGIPGPVWALAFTADGKGLYFGTLDDQVKYWKISAADDTQWGRGKKQRRFQVTKGLPLGELQFARKCSVCHSLKPGETNRAGPSLYKVLGRKAGSLSEYPYSNSLLASNLVWNEQNINDLFVKGPHAVVPGSKMPLQKIPDAEKRAALIEFLRNSKAE